MGDPSFTPSSTSSAASVTSTTSTSSTASTDSSTTAVFLKQILLWPLRLLGDLLSDLLSIPYRWLVDCLGNFLGDVLEHPRVQHATAQAIARGMNYSMEDPSLPRRAAKLYIQLQEDSDMSRQLGEQFPKVAANFLAGAASSLKRQASFSKLTKKHRTPSPTPSLPALEMASSSESLTPESSPEMQHRPVIETPKVITTTTKSPKSILETDNSGMLTSNEFDILAKLAFPWVSAFGKVDSPAIVAKPKPQRT